MKHQKSIVLSLALISSPVLAFAADFDMVNRSGYSITEVYAGPSNEKSWGENILSGQIRNGQRLLVELDTYGYGCLWDLMYVFSDGKSFEEYEVDICRIDGQSFVID